MKNCILLVHASSFGASPEGTGALVVHWDEWDVPVGHVSLPARLVDDLIAIRTEHAASSLTAARCRITCWEGRATFPCGGVRCSTSGTRR